MEEPMAYNIYFSGMLFPWLTISIFLVCYSHGLQYLYFWYVIPMAYNIYIFGMLFPWLTISVFLVCYSHGLQYLYFWYVIPMAYNICIFGMLFPWLTISVFLVCYSHGLQYLYFWYAFYALMVKTCSYLEKVIPCGESYFVRDNSLVFAFTITYFNIMTDVIFC